VKGLKLWKKSSKTAVKCRHVRRNEEIGNLNGCIPIKKVVKFSEVYLVEVVWRSL
jgi:hypothetical protein